MTGRRTGINVTITILIIVVTGIYDHRNSFHHVPINLHL